jgi:hypothetical protein
VEFKEYAEIIKANSSKDQKEILSRFISTLPREVLKKLFVVVWSRSSRIEKKRDRNISIFAPD